MRNELIKPTLPNSSVHISGSARPARNDGVCDLHMHAEFEVLKVIEGKTEFFINGKEYPLHMGDIIFVNSRVPHTTTIHKGSRAFYVQFLPQINLSDNEMYFSKYLSRFINQGNRDAVIFEEGSEINKELSFCLMNILEENMYQKKSYDIYIKSYTYNILAALYRNEIINAPEEYFYGRDVIKLFPALEYIDSHYWEPITLGELSSLINVSEHYFCRLFKKCVNTPFVQYLNFVRVCKAEKMLGSTDKSISEISYETGFSSVSYFNRIFKKYKYCTPSEYKKIKFESGM